METDTRSPAVAAIFPAVVKEAPNGIRVKSQPKDLVEVTPILHEFLNRVGSDGLMEIDCARKRFIDLDELKEVWRKNVREMEGEEDGLSDSEKALKIRTLQDLMEGSRIIWRHETVYDGVKLSKVQDREYKRMVRNVLPPAQLPAPYLIENAEMRNSMGIAASHFLGLGLMSLVGYMASKTIQTWKDPNDTVHIIWALVAAVSWIAVEVALFIVKGTALERSKEKIN